MKRLLAILDCHRDPDYMPEMLASAGEFREWPGERWQIWSGEEPPRHLRGFDFLRRPKDGTAKAMLAAFQLMVERRADSLLLLENDVKFDVGALDVMATMDIPIELPFISFFQPAFEPGPSPSLEYVQFHRPEKGDKPRYAWGQCLLLSRACCEFVLTSKLAYDWFRPNYGDKLLGRVLYPHWTEYGVYWPNLVEHLGDKSSYGWDSSKWKRANAPIMH